jgi:hypothetical protein
VQPRIVQVVPFGGAIRSEKDCEKGLVTMVATQPESFAFYKDEASVRKRRMINIEATNPSKALD